MKHYNETDYHITGGDGRSYHPHNSRDFEIIQTWSDGGYFLINDHIFPIQSGAVYIINAIETHCSNPTDFDRYTRSKIILDSDHFMKLAEAAGLKNMVNNAITSSRGCFFSFTARENVPYQIDRLFRQAADAFNAKNELSPAILASSIIQILILLFQNASHSDRQEEIEDNIINRVMMYINQNINETQNLTLDKICENIHISKSHLCHIFKETTGLSVMQYTNSLKLTQAKKLLLSTNMKIQDIAFFLGYSSSTFFCKVFKGSVNCSPTQYRNAKQKNITDPKFPDPD